MTSPPRQTIRLMKITTALVVLASVGLVGCGSTSRVPPSPTSGGVHSLSAAPSIKLVRWFIGLRTCLANDGLAPGAVTVAREQLSVTVDPSVEASVLAGESTGCTATTGNPPDGTSLQAARGRMVLRLPNPWRLDTRAATRAAKTGSSSNP